MKIGAQVEGALIARAACEDIDREELHLSERAE